MLLKVFVSITWRLQVAWDNPSQIFFVRPDFFNSDYYYNAGSSPAPTPSPLKHAAPEQAPPKPAAPAPPPPAPKSAVPVPPPPQEETSPEDEGEYEEVVEYVEEYEGEDGEEYEEEIVEEYEEEYEDENPTAASESAGLSDLQALLAQKQAELAKLQGA